MMNVVTNFLFEFNELFCFFLSKTFFKLLVLSHSPKLKGIPSSVINSKKTISILLNFPTFDELQMFGFCA